MWVVQKSEWGWKTFISIKWKSDEAPYLLCDWEKLEWTALQGFLTSFKVKEFDWANWAFRQIQLWLKKDDEDVVMTIVLESMMGRTLANCLCGLESLDQEIYISPYRSKNEQNTVFVKVMWAEKWLPWKFDKDFLAKTFLDWKKYDLEKMDNFYLEELTKIFKNINITEPPVVEPENTIENIVAWKFDWKAEPKKAETSDPKDDMPF